MTRDADFKKLVRARMAASDETYLQARTELMQTQPAIEQPPTDRAAYPIPKGAPSPLAQDPIIPTALGRSVRQFFDDGRLRTIPTKRTKRMAVPLVLVTPRTYPEAEVSRMLAEVHEDHAYLRRELVNVGCLRREAGECTLAPAPPARDVRWARSFPARRPTCSRRCGSARRSGDARRAGVALRRGA